MASFTLQTTAVSPGRHRIGARKTDHVVSQAEKNSVFLGGRGGGSEINSLFLLCRSSAAGCAVRNFASVRGRRVDHMHRSMSGLKERGHCCYMTTSHRHVSYRFLVCVLYFMFSVPTSTLLSLGSRGLLHHVTHAAILSLHKCTGSTSPGVRMVK